MSPCIEFFEANTAAVFTLDAALAQDLGSSEGQELLQILGPIMA